MSEFVDEIFKEINENLIDKNKINKLNHLFIEYGIIEDANKAIPIIIKDNKGNTKTVEMSVKDVFLNIENGSPLTGMGGRNILERVEFKIANDSELDLILNDIVFDLIEKDISEAEIRARLDAYTRTTLKRHIDNSINEAFQTVADKILLGKKNNDKYYYNMKKIRKYVKSSVKNR